MSPPFVPPDQPVLVFETARQVESSCSYDKTTVHYSLDLGVTWELLSLDEAQISLGNQTIGTDRICGNSLSAQTVLAPLPEGTNRVAFHFDTVDTLMNNYAGQFIDSVEIVGAGVTPTATGTVALPTDTPVPPTSTSIPTNTPEPCYDLDGDGVVRNADLALLVLHWGHEDVDPHDATLDLDGDGIIWMGDFVMVATAWGDVCQ